MDVVHNLFVDLLAKPSRDLELSYLYRAVTNRCLNWIRDRNNRSRLLLDRDHDLRGPSRTTIDGLVVDLDLLSRLAARLDRKSQEIVVYHYFDDLSQDEVASLMGMSRRAVVKRLAKIRDKARSVAGEHVAETSS